MWLTLLLLLWIACIDASNCKISRHRFFSRVSFRPVAAVLLPMLINFDSIPAHASREVANIPATGLVFKDYLKINAFEDPKIRGITIYLSDFDRSITDKLSKDFFDDPSTSSLSCAQTGPVLASDIVAISKDRAGEEVFEESRNLFFKVRRSLIMNTVSTVLHNVEGHTLCYLKFLDSILSIARPFVSGESTMRAATRWFTRPTAPDSTRRTAIRAGTRALSARSTSTRRLLPIRLSLCMRIDRYTCTKIKHCSQIGKRT